jgi:hypothetical protein
MYLSISLILFKMINFRKAGIDLQCTMHFVLVFPAIMSHGQGLFCFSSSTPLPTQKPLDQFGVFAWYEHNDDFAAAARALRCLQSDSVNTIATKTVAKVATIAVANSKN